MGILSFYEMAMVVENGDVVETGNFSTPSISGSPNSTTMTSAEEKKDRNKIFYILVLILLILILGAGGYLVYTRYFGTTEETNESSTEETGEEAAISEETQDWVSAEIQVGCPEVTSVSALVPADAVVSINTESVPWETELCTYTEVTYNGQVLSFSAPFEIYPNEVVDYELIGQNTGLGGVSKDIYRYVLSNDNEALVHYAEFPYTCTESNSDDCLMMSAALSDRTVQGGAMTHWFSVGTQAEDSSDLAIFDQIILSLQIRGDEGAGNAGTDDSVTAEIPRIYAIYEDCPRFVQGTKYENAATVEFYYPEDVEMTKTNDRCNFLFEKGGLSMSTSLLDTSLYGPVVHIGSDHYKILGDDPLLGKWVRGYISNAGSFQGVMYMNEVVETGCVERSIEVPCGQSGIPTDMHARILVETLDSSLSYDEIESILDVFDGIVTTIRVEIH